MTMLFATDRLGWGADPLREEEHPQSPAECNGQTPVTGENRLCRATGTLKGKGICFQGRRDEVRSKASLG